MGPLADPLVTWELRVKKISRVNRWTKISVGDMAWLEKFVQLLFLANRDFILINFKILENFLKFLIFSN